MLYSVESPPPHQVQCRGIKEQADEGAKKCCALHMKVIARLDDDDRQEVANILYDYRVDELEDTVDRRIRALGCLLADAASGASKRFSSSPRRFRENCWNRIQHLHFRRDEVYQTGVDLIRRIRDEWFDVKRIGELHGQLKIDEEVRKHIRTVQSIEEEAEHYIN